MQAKRIAERAAGLSFEALITSPLKRTRQTAEEIGKVTGHTPEFRDLFVERKLPKSVVGRQFGNLLALRRWWRWEKSLHGSGARVGDGENFQDMVRRIDSALDFLLKRPEKRLLVVTHALFLRDVVARVVLGDALTPEILGRFRYKSIVDNTGLTALAYGRNLDGMEWRLWTFNDRSHLG
jgi:probable phosphoglycerate mutase